MKNYIPLVLAVLLALAAVLLVSRLINRNRQASEGEAHVVAAQRDLKKGDLLADDSALMMKVIPVSARPANSIVWSQHSLVVGQTLDRPVRSGDYILTSDLKLSGSMSALVGQGEWAVTISVGSSGIGHALQPGDEVAVIASMPVEVTTPTADLSQPAQKNSKLVTLVLFPRVRVLENGGSKGRGESGTEIVLALPPQQAQVLIAAQRRAELTLALRRPNDTSALNRSEAGMVDEGTFQELLKKVKAVTVPDALGPK